MFKVKSRSIFYLTFLTFLFCSHVHAEEPTITVVVSSTIRPYLLALEGFRTNFKRPFELLYVNENPELVRYQLSKANSNLLITIGPEAAKLVDSLEKKPAKHLSLMVLDTKDFLSTNKICGIDMRIPVDVQLRVISERLGKKRRVGILYNPGENIDIIRMAVESSRGLDLTVIPISVEKREEIVKKLQTSYPLIDILLFIPDSTIISESLVIHLIKEALLHGILSVGYNKFFVETGAVMSCDIDYKELGVWGAGLSEDVLSGIPCGMVNPPFEVSWNEKVWKLVQKKLPVGQGK